MLTVTLESASVQDVLAKLSARLSDLTPAMEGIGATLQSHISARFETQSDPLGDPWAAWAPATYLSYPRAGSAGAERMGGEAHGRILDRYGDLLGSLTHQANATSATVGFGNPVAAHHEWGTKHMPRRGLLFADPDAGTLAPDDERAVLDNLSDFLGVS